MAQLFRQYPVLGCTRLKPRQGTQLKTPFSGKACINVVIALAASCVLLSGLAASSRAHDSKIPANANHNYLPTIDWIAFHWSPVDEVQLAEALGMSHVELYNFQADDHQSLDGLARNRRISLSKLRARLYEQWKAERLTPSQSREIKRRISLMLSQPHLAQHVFWHPFHSPAFRRNAARSARVMFGVSLARYRALRRAGRTQLEIAALGNKTETHLRRKVISHLKANIREGVASKQMLPSQADRMYKRQRSLVECWMRSPQPHFDPDIPFGGDVNGGHGVHTRASKVGIVTPKPAAGCWIPIVPADYEPATTAGSDFRRSSTARVRPAAASTAPMFCEL